MTKARYIGFAFALCAGLAFGQTTNTPATTAGQCGATGFPACTIYEASAPLPTGAATSALQSATQAPVAPGAATATASQLGGGQYNSGGVTMTNGQQGAVQLGSDGRLLASLASAGPVAPGTAATKSNLSGCVYTAAGVAVTDGQQVADQCAADGSRKVTIINSSYKNVWIKPTIQAAAYAQGTSLGGLMSFTVQASGALMAVQGRSASGSVIGKTVRAWDHNPTNTTCTDKVAFAGSAADDLYMVVNGSLGQLFMAASGDAATASSGALTNLALPYVSDGTTIYMCVTENAAETPPNTTDWQFGVKTAQ